MSTIAETQYNRWFTPVEIAELLEVPLKSCNNMIKGHRLEEMVTETTHTDCEGGVKHSKKTLYDVRDFAEETLNFFAYALLDAEEGDVPPLLMRCDHLAGTMQGIFPEIKRDVLMGAFYPAQNAFEAWDLSRVSPRISPKEGKLRRDIRCPKIFRGGTFEAWGPLKRKKGGVPWVPEGVGLGFSKI
jgi:hypothetical protein